MSVDASRMRARVSSKSEPGSPEVEIAASWPPRLASLPDQVRYRERLCWRWGSSMIPRVGMIAVAGPVVGGEDLDAPAAVVVDPAVALEAHEARHVDRPLALGGLDRRVGRGVEPVRAQDEALGLPVHDLGLLAARRGDRDDRERAELAVVEGERRPAASSCRCPRARSASTRGSRRTGPRRTPPGTAPGASSRRCRG